MKTTRRALRYFWLGLGQLFCFYPEDKAEMIKILKDNRSELLGRTEWESIGEDFRAIGNDMNKKVLLQPSNTLALCRLRTCCVNTVMQSRMAQKES